VWAECGEVTRGPVAILGVGRIRRETVTEEERVGEGM
jgi:hypothetical protein